MSMMEWIAVCGCGSSATPVLPKEQRLEARARLIAEYTEIRDNALWILQSGKGDMLLNAICAQAFQATMDPSAILNPASPQGNAWLGTFSDEGTRYPEHCCSVVVEDVGGNIHFVPATIINAYTFMKYISALAASPNVAAIAVRSVSYSGYPNRYSPVSSPPPERVGPIGKGEQAWGSIIIGQRYGSLQEMTGIVTGAVIPQAEPILPQTLQPSSTELMHPLAQATVPTTSQQTVGGTTFSPWLLVGGAAAVVAGVALLRRNK